MSKFKLFFTSLFLFLTTQAFAQSNKTTELDSVLSDLHEEGIFDGTLVISEKGNTVYSTAFGMYNGSQVNTQTPFYLGSVSNVMTAAAVLSLVDEGRIKLDDPVGTYLSPWTYEQITVRQLLNQTSGLNFFPTIVAYHDSTNNLTTEKLLEYIAEDKHYLSFNPGTRFASGAENYTVLRKLIESVTNESFETTLEDRVFTPAGMTNTHIESAGSITWISWESGNGDVFHASAEDLLAFEHAFWNGDIVSPELVKEAKNPPVLKNGKKSQYVMGRYVDNNPYQRVGNFGEGPDAKAGLWREEKNGTVYALLITGDGINRTEEILNSVMKIWNGDSYELPEPRPETDIPTSILAQHVGTYSSKVGEITVTMDDGQLYLKPENGEKNQLTSASENVFYFSHQNISWKFVQDNSGETSGLMLMGQPSTLAEKVE